MNRTVRVGMLLAAMVLARGWCQKPGETAAGALPEAALKAIQASFPNAAIGDVEKEREKGVPYFEVELREGGREFEVEVTADGKIGEIEAKVAPGDLPEAITAKVKELAAGAQIRGAEKHEVRGVPLYGTFATLAEPVVVYEVTYRAPGAQRNARVTLRANGELVRAAARDDDDDDEEEEEDEDED